MTAWRYLGPEGAHARPAVRFAAELPEPQQRELFEALTAIKPHRDRRAPRQSLERIGASVLTARDELPAKRPWIVRLYFTSMADERLCTEFGGLTEPEANAIASGRDAELWSVKRPLDVKCTGLDESDPLAVHYPAYVGTCAAETWCACRGHGMVAAPIPSVRKGVRVVVFPSEIR